MVDIFKNNNLLIYTYGYKIIVKFECAEIKTPVNYFENCDLSGAIRFANRRLRKPLAKNIKGNWIPTIMKLSSLHKLARESVPELQGIKGADVVLYFKRLKDSGHL